MGDLFCPSTEDFRINVCGYSGNVFVFGVFRTHTFERVNLLAEGFVILFMKQSLLNPSEPARYCSERFWKKIFFEVFTKLLNFPTWISRKLCNNNFLQLVLMILPRDYRVSRKWKKTGIGVFWQSNWSFRQLEVGKRIFSFFRRCWLLGGTKATIGICHIIWICKL